MNLKYRHELKFLCPEENLRHMEEKIKHICQPDPHVGASGAYVIRSLYFDTYDDLCYAETLSGVDNRKKYRIRTYDNNADLIRLECKYSRHGMKAKEYCALTVRQCEALMQGTPLSLFPEEGGSGDLLHTFLLEQRQWLLTPRIIAEYVRTPYVFPAGNVRITFDRSIRSSSQTRRFLEKDIAFRCILPDGQNILEVKYDEYLPAAIRELLTAGQDLQRISFSKYSLCRNYGSRS